VAPEWTGRCREGRRRVVRRPYRGVGCQVASRGRTHSPQQGLGRISATITLAAPTTTRSVRVLLGAAGCALVACWPVERGQRGVFVPAAAPLPAPANSSATRV
jgi:hypothetical protein